jgi:hypothetical protein
MQLVVYYMLKFDIQKMISLHVTRWYFLVEDQEDIRGDKVECLTLFGNKEGIKE